MDLREIEALLFEAYIAAEGTRLRDEDRRKAVEIAGLLEELARARKHGHLVDAAAGKAYVGVLAAKLVGYERVTVLEREADRVEASRIAAARLGVADRVTVVQADVADAQLWPEKIDLIAALHACGPASDHVIDAASRSSVKWLFLVPCCYGAEVRFAQKAELKAAAMGIAHHGEVRRRVVSALIDGERTLRLEAQGWETTVIPFVAPTITPHNLLWRARRANEPKRMEEAAAALSRFGSTRPA